MVTLTSKTPSSVDHFETKTQAKFAKSDQKFEQQQEEFMDIKEKQHQEFNNIEMDWLLLPLKQFSSKKLLEC